MDREKRASPDGKAVAVRSDSADPEAYNAWGVMHCQHGGHWASTSEVADWPVLIPVSE